MSEVFFSFLKFIIYDDLFSYSEQIFTLGLNFVFAIVYSFFFLMSPTKPKSLFSQGTIFLTDFFIVLTEEHTSRITH